MKITENIKNKNIAIIGATGFIGGRLFEMLKEDQIDPLVVLRSFSKAANLAKYNYNDVLCDLNNSNKINDSLSNVDVCFNCAHDFTASQKDMLSAIKNLGMACINNKVKLIHLSSVAVHEPMNAPYTDENSEKCKKDNFYGYTKNLIEQTLMDLKEKAGLDVIILRPTNVYGPFSGAWTVGPCTKLLSGRLVLTEKSKQSINNLIYVDDVCNYMIKAASTEINNTNSIFLINGPDDNISWSKFYEDYSSLLSVDLPMYINEDEIIKNNKNFLKFLINGVKNIAMFEDNFITSYILSLLKKLPNSMKSKLKIYQKDLSSKLGDTIFYPNNKEMLDYKNKSFVKAEKAVSVLGYKPLYNYKDGLKKNSTFIKWYFEKV